MPGSLAAVVAGAQLPLADNHELLSQQMPQPQAPSAALDTAADRVGHPVTREPARMLRGASLAGLAPPCAVPGP